MENEKFDLVAHARGLLGLVIGGVVGLLIFQWMVKQGFYGLAIPGAVMGLGCGYASRIHSPLLAALCGISAFFLTAYAEWKSFPFIDDESFTYFLSHLHLLKGMTLIMFGLGIVFATWFGLGRPKTRMQ